MSPRSSSRWPVCWSGRGGIELATIDKSAVGGVISVSNTSVVYKLVNSNMSVALSWIVLVVVLAIFAALTLSRAARRRPRD